MWLICEVLNQHIIINWIYYIFYYTENPRGYYLKVLKNIHEVTHLTLTALEMGHFAHARSIYIHCMMPYLPQRWSVLQTSQNYSIYNLHGFSTQFNNYSCTISTTKQHTVNCFHCSFKRPYISGLAFIYKGRLFCVCLHILHKQTLHLSLGFKVPCGEQQKQGAVQKNCRRECRGLADRRTITRAQSNPGNKNKSTYTQIHIHLLHVLNT